MSNDKNLQSAILSVGSAFPIKGIYYIGQYGTSGYAMAARGYLFHYFSNGLNVTWEPLHFDNSTLSDDDVYNVVIKSLMYKPIGEHDMVMMHSTPDLWPQFIQQKPELFTGKHVNGYCTWETNQLPKAWVECINQTAGEVWCPSKYNEQAFKDSGVTRPIRVIPHIFLPYTLPDPGLVKLTDQGGNIIEKNGQFTFYCIGELIARKGIVDLIHSFCKAFEGRNDVRLILKVHYRDYSKGNRDKCEEMIQEVLKAYPTHPPIIYILQNMSHRELLGLHSIGDCYVSLTRSEGFGLTIFDAFKYGKKVIATGYSGHMDFLGQDHPGLVKYQIAPVTGMESFSTNYTSDQLWAVPDLDHAIELMRRAIS